MQSGMLLQWRDVQGAIMGTLHREGEEILRDR